MLQSIINNFLSRNHVNTEICVEYLMPRTNVQVGCIEHGSGGHVKEPFVKHVVSGGGSLSLWYAQRKLETS